MKIKAIVLLAAVVVVSALFQTVNAVARYKSSCDCTEACCCDSENVRFLKEDGGWKLNKYRGLSTFETTSYDAGKRGINHVFSSGDATFLNKGLEEALSNGQRVSSVEITINCAGEALILSIFLKDAEEKRSYDIHWFVSLGRNENCLRVEGNGYRKYEVRTPNSNGYFLISYRDGYYGDIERFISYFGIQSNCPRCYDCNCNS